jgi:HEAT repeat protein
MVLSLSMPTKKKPGKNPAAQALGRLGGQKKVPKGVAVLSDEERSERGRAAAAARWGSPKKKAKKRG